MFSEVSGLGRRGIGSQKFLTQRRFFSVNLAWFDSGPNPEINRGGLRSVSVTYLAALAGQFSDPVIGKIR